MTQMNNTRSADPRASRRERRRARLQLIAGDRPATLKVYAANETLRDVLRHPNGARFHDAMDQAVEWPNDSFTARRIAEGAVLTDGPGSAEPAPPDDETLNAREQAAARKGQKVEAAKDSAQQKRDSSQPRPASEPQPAA